MRNLFIILLIALALLTACTVYAESESGMNFWLSDKTIDVIYNCDNCSPEIDWSTVCECFVNGSGNHDNKH